MKNKRRIAGIVFLIIALMLGGISYSMSKQTQKTVDIVVLKKDIERGKVIKEQDLMIAKRGSYNLPNGIVTENSQIVGKVALNDMKKDREIYKDEITSDTTQTSFSSRILGKAIAVKTDLASAVGGEITPESFVQIAIVSKGEGGQALTSYPESTRAVRVLEVKQDSGQSTTQSNNDGSNIQAQVKPAVVVLDMNEEQIKQVLPFNYNGVIHLILLNESEAKLEREKLGL